MPAWRRAHLGGMAALAIGRSLLPPRSPAYGYTGRVLLALTAAYYAAYWLELESPASAATTVLVLMNASAGAILSKSLWRFVGTLIGVIVAIALIAGFVQAPVLFIMALALWIGLCTAVASLLRFFRGYAAVLAGYTVSIVAFGALSEPERIFDLATARLAVITIGIAATALAFLLTAPPPTDRGLEGSLAALIAKTGRLLATALSEEAEAPGISAPALAALRTARTALANDLTAFDQAIEFAAVEDVGLGRFSGDLRVAGAELLSAITGSRRLGMLMRPLATAEPRLAEAAAEFRRMAETLALCHADRAGRAGLARRIAETRARLENAAALCRDLPALSALDQAMAMLDQIGAAVASLVALQDGRPQARAIRLRQYVNPVTALRNGSRAAIAVTLAGLFWIVTGWSSGSAMLSFVAPVCALVGISDSAAAGSIEFAKGTISAVILGTICNTALLPQVAGFPLLTMTLLPFLAVGIFLTTKPRFTLAATAFCIFFNTIAAATNPPVYSLSGTLNTGLGFLVGVVFVVLSFRILLPPNPQAEAAVLIRSLAIDVQRLARRGRPRSWLAWEHLQHQKLIRLGRRLAAQPARQLDAIEGGSAAVLIARVLFRLVESARDPALPEAARHLVGGVLRTFRHVLDGPNHAARAATAARTAAAALAGHDDTPLRPVLSLAAALYELSELLTRHASFFRAGMPPRPSQPLPASAALAPAAA